MNESKSLMFWEGRWREGGKKRDSGGMLLKLSIATGSTSKSEKGGRRGTGV